MRIQLIRDLEQGVRPAAFFLLRHIQSRVLIADRELLGDRLEKSDLLIEPDAGCFCIVQTQKPEHFVPKFDRYDQERTRFERLCKKFERGVFGLCGVVYADGLCQVESLGELRAIVGNCRALALWNLFVAPPLVTYYELIIVA